MGLVRGPDRQERPASAARRARPLLVNTRRTKEGKLSKRPGDDRTVIDTSFNGTYAGPAVRWFRARRRPWRDSQTSCGCRSTRARPSSGASTGGRSHLARGRERTSLRRQAARRLAERGDLGSSPRPRARLVPYQLTVIDADQRGRPAEDGRSCPTRAAQSWRPLADADGNVWLFAASYGFVISAHKFTGAHGRPGRSTFFNDSSLSITSLDAAPAHGDGGDGLVATSLGHYGLVHHSATRSATSTPRPGWPSAGAGDDAGLDRHRVRLLQRRPAASAVRYRRGQRLLLQLLAAEASPTRPSSRSVQRQRDTLLRSTVALQEFVRRRRRTPSA